MSSAPVTITKKSTKRDQAIHAAQTVYFTNKLDSDHYCDIAVSDTAALNAAIKAAAPRNSYRRHTPAEIRMVANWAERQLEQKGIPLSKRQGYIAEDRDPGREVSKSLANRFPQPDPATIVRLFRDASGWRLVRIGKSVVFPNQKEHSRLERICQGRVPAPKAAPAPVVKKPENAGKVVKMGDFKVAHTHEGFRITPDEVLRDPAAWAEWSAQEAQRLRAELDAIKQQKAAAVAA